MIYRVAKIVNFSISPQKTKKVYANSCISYYFQPPWRSGKGLSSPAEREAEGERTDRTDSGTNLAHARRQEARQIPQKKHSIIRRVHAREALTSQAAGPPPQPRLSARQLQGLNFQSAGLKIQSAGLKPPLQASARRGQFLKKRIVPLKTPSFPLKSKKPGFDFALPAPSLTFAATNSLIVPILAHWA